MKFLNPLAFVFASLLLLVGPRAAEAQMSKQDQARARFTKGMALYQAGKYLQAIREMKAAYKVIPKPIVLFYIAEVYKDADLKDEAISYYRRYLNEARTNAKTKPTRDKAEATIVKLGGTLAAPKDPTVPIPTPGVTPKTPPTTVKKPRKHRRKYKKGELIHTPLEEAKPNHPAKLEVELPENIKRAWIYVYYRKVGQSKYQKAKMKVDKNDIYYFIIPCKGVQGPLLQYYIEAVGVSGRRVAGSGTDSSPFIVDVNRSNPLQPGGKMSCDGLTTDGSTAPIETATTKGKKKGDRPRGKKRSYYLTIAAGVVTTGLIVASVLSGQMAAVQASNLEDAQMGVASGANPDVYPPTKRYRSGIMAFSGNVADYQKTGKAYESTMFLTAGLAVVGGLATIYFTLDYLEVIPDAFSLDNALGYRGTDDTKVTVAPLVGDDFYGIGGSISF